MDVGLRQAEDGADRRLDVLHALRLVVDEELAALLHDDGGGVRLHGRVVLGLDLVGFAHARRGARHAVDHVAARLRRRRDAAALLGRLVGFRLRPLEVRLRRLGLALHLDQRGGVARDAPLLRHDERHELHREEDRGVVQRAEGQAGRADLVLPAAVEPRRARAVLLGEHLHHAGEGLGARGVDPRDAAVGDGAADRGAMEQPVGGKVGRVFRAARDLQRPVHAGAGLADMRSVEHQANTFWAWCCGVPFAD